MVNLPLKNKYPKTKSVLMLKTGELSIKKGL